MAHGHDHSFGSDEPFVALTAADEEYRETPPGSTYEPDLAADCHDRHTVQPTAKGDYKIRVTECRKADAYHGRFSFRVRVR